MCITHICESVRVHAVLQYMLPSSDASAIVIFTLNESGTIYLGDYLLYVCACKHAYSSQNPFGMEGLLHCPYVAISSPLAVLLFMGHVI